MSMRYIQQISHTVCSTSLDQLRLTAVSYGHCQAVRLSSRVPGHPLSQCDYTSLDSYAWNYRELATLPTLSESVAEGGFEPRIIGSLLRNLASRAILIPKPLLLLFGCFRFVIVSLKLPAGFLLVANNNNNNNNYLPLL